MIRLPGLIDPHVHLRDMGQVEKEDFLTGTSAALAGGYTTVLDMPNNKIPITTRKRLDEKISTAKEKIVCDIGFHFGSMGNNLEQFELVKNKTIGLKLFLNETTGNYLLNETKLEEIFIAWPKEKVILFHAEEEKIDLVINVLKKHQRPVHICHVATAPKLQRIIAAKELGLPITCGVTPHHLFLTENDATSLKGFGIMKPPLKSKEDVQFLWKHLGIIDCIESDHAPHTKEEKKVSERVAQSEGLPTTRRSFATSQSEGRIDRALAGGKTATGPAPTIPFGVPGLETSLPLLLTAMHDQRLSIDDIIRLCHTGPKNIFNIPTDENTYIELDPNESYEIKNENLFTKAKWSPFDGWKVRGKVRKVTIRGQEVFSQDEITTPPGSGKILKS